MSMSRKLLIREQTCIYKYNTGTNNQLFIKWMLGKWASSRVRCCHNWSGTTGVPAGVCGCVCVCVCVYVCVCLSVGLCVPMCVCELTHTNTHTHTHSHTHIDTSPHAPNFPQTRQEQAESAHYRLMSCLISAEYKSLIVKRCMFILINYCTKVTGWKHNDMEH